MSRSVLIALKVSGISILLESRILIPVLVIIGILELDYILTIIIEFTIHPMFITTMGSNSSTQPQETSDLQIKVLARVVIMVLLMFGFINIKDILKDTTNCKEKPCMPKLVRQQTNFSSSLLFPMTSMKLKQSLLFLHLQLFQLRLHQAMESSALFKKLRSILSSMEVGTMLLALMQLADLQSEHLLEESAKIKNIS